MSLPDDASGYTAENNNTKSTFNETWSARGFMTNVFLVLFERGNKAFFEG